MDTPVPDTLSDLGRAALAYAARGWPVFPCDPVSKRPLTKAGFKDAATDEAAIAGWWRRWPGAMIGLPTGAAIGCFVIDLDAGTDKAGRLFTAEELLAALGERIGAGALDTVRVSTPRGGLHLYFRLPAGASVRNRAGLLPRTDVRGDGGYVIAPPSRRDDGRLYAWASPKGTQPLESAAALAFVTGDAPAAGGLLDQPAAAPSPPARPAGRDPGEAARRYGLAALDRAAGEVAGAASGTRNATLNEAALKLGHLVAAGMISESLVVGTLSDAARRAGLQPKEIGGTIRSGLKAGLAQPFDLSRLKGSARGRPEPPPPPEEERRVSRPQKSAPWDEGEWPPLYVMPEVDEAALKWCAGLDPCDTDNGRRLLRHFGRDLAVLQAEGVTSAAWLVWNGAFWDLQHGQDARVLVAQQVGERIKLEVDLMEHTPAEQKDLAAWETWEAEEGQSFKERAAGMAAIRAVPPGKRTAEERAALDAFQAEEARRRALFSAAAGAREALQQRKGSRHDFGVTSKNAARIEKMLLMAAPHIALPADAWNPDPLLVACRDHTLRFAVAEVEDFDCPDPDVTRMMREVTLTATPGHARADNVTKCLAVPWRPDSARPIWDAFLARFLPVPAVRDYVQVACGLGLLGVPVQRVVMHIGSGANGKSVFLETICRVLGDMAASLPVASVQGRDEIAAGGASPDLARLHGVRFVRVAEIKKNEPLREEAIKRLTGGEKIAVRELFRPYFEFQPQFVLHLAGNGLPPVEGTDNGIWRRIDVVTWPVQLAAEEQREFEEVLAGFRPEYPGILAWLAEGARRFLAEGLVAPQEVRDATAAYRGEMDPIPAFLAACVDRFPPGSGHEVGAQAMYDAYLAWSEANARPAKGKNLFPKSLMAAGLVRSDQVPHAPSRPSRFWLDCQLHDVPRRDPGAGLPEER